MKIEDLMLRAVALENILRAYKTALYQTMQESEDLKYKDKINAMPNKRLKKEVEKERKACWANYEKRIKKAYTLNSEVTRRLEIQNMDRFDVDVFIDIIHTAFSTFTDLCFKHMDNVLPSDIEKYHPAILKEDESGNLFIKNKKLIIHHNIK